MERTLFNNVVRFLYIADGFRTCDFQGEIIKSPEPRALMIHNTMSTDLRLHFCWHRKIIHR